MREISFHKRRSPRKYRIQSLMLIRTFATTNGSEFSWSCAYRITECNERCYNELYLAQFDVTLLEPTLASAKENPREFLKFLFAGNPWNCDCDTLKTVQVINRSPRLLIRFMSSVKSLHGGPSGCTLRFVDIKLRVAFYYKNKEAIL